MSKVMRSKRLDEKAFYSLDIKKDSLCREYDSNGTKSETVPRSQTDEIISEAQAEADGIINEARERSEQIVREAEEEKERIFEKARDKGYNKGYEDALEAAQNEADKTRQRALKIVKEMEHERSKAIYQAEDDVVDLSIAIAAKIIRQHIEVNRETVLEITRHVLKKLYLRDHYTIFVNPQDVELLEQYIEELKKSAGSSSYINILGDEGVGLGGCKVETEDELVDASLESQLDEMRRVLRGEREK